MPLELEAQLDAALRDLGRKGREAIQRAIALTAEEVWRNVRKLAPVDHGRLAGSFALEPMDALSWKVSSAVEYARAVNDGTGTHGPTGRPYEIRPKFKRALFWKGADHPVAVVMHPGIKGTRYAERAIEETEGRVEEFARRAVREVDASV